jgi:hypothetical protein
LLKLQFDEKMKEQASSTAAKVADLQEAEAELKRQQRLLEEQRVQQEVC